MLKTEEAYESEELRTTLRKELAEDDKPCSRSRKKGVLVLMEF